MTGPSEAMMPLTSPMVFSSAAIFLSAVAMRFSSVAGVGSTLLGRAFRLLLRALEQAFEVALVFGGRIQLGLQGVQIFVEMGFDHLELDQVAEGIEQTLIVGQIAALEALTRRSYRTA